MSWEKFFFAGASGLMTICVAMLVYIGSRAEVVVEKLGTQVENNTRALIRVETVVESLPPPLLLHRVAELEERLNRLEGDGDS